MEENNNNNNNNGSTNTNNNQIDKENDIYATISFEEIVEKVNFVQDVPFVDEVDYYLKENFEEAEKKEVIEVCVEREKTICDSIKKDIEDKKVEIDEKQEKLVQRKKELPSVIEQEQKELNNKIQDYIVLENHLANLSEDSEEYKNISQKLNEIKGEIDEKTEKRDNLQNEYRNMDNEFEKLETEKKEYSKTIELYNDRVDKVNNKIDEIDFMNINEKPERIGDAVKKEEMYNQINNQNVQEPVINTNSNEQQQQVKNNDRQEQVINNANQQVNGQQALVDPSKQSKIKQLFNKVKQKVKEIATKVSKNKSDKEQRNIEVNEYIERLKDTETMFMDEEEKPKENNEYIDRLKNTEAIFNDKEVQNEFLESLKTQVNVEVEEQAEQMKREGRTKARDEINEKDLDDMVLA